MIKHLSKWDLQHPDIVSILTFCAYSGTCFSKNHLAFTGPAVNRIKPILSKYFHVSQYERPTLVKSKKTVERRIYITSAGLVREAVGAGWKFKKNDQDKVPNYVFHDIDLFRTLLSIILDTRACLVFDSGNIRRKVSLSIESSNPVEWNKIRFFLDGYGLPMGYLNAYRDKTVNGGGRYEIAWYGEDIYKILEFIRWDLQRPWNARMIKYLKENYDARQLPKGKFL